jgi:hypothetical protein
MRRGRFFTGAMAVIAAALVWIPGGVAGGGGGGTPNDIARDLSDGVLNGSYTKAQLERYLRDATHQVYTTLTSTTSTTPTTSTTQSTTQSTTTSSTASTPGAGGGGNLPESNGNVEGTSKETGGNQPLAIKPAKPLAATKTRGHLPFTGAQLGLFAIVGLALLAMGFLLRSTARQKPTQAG